MGSILFKRKKDRIEAEQESDRDGMADILYKRNIDRTETEQAPGKYGYGEDDQRPNPQIKTNRRFRDPVTLYSDWHNELYEDKPHVNWWFEIVHDWYARQEEGYEPYRIRAQQTPIDWKSKIGNSDMSMNFKVEHKETIVKGDYAIRDDGLVYLLNWQIQPHANNLATQSLECNDYLTFTRALKTDNNYDGSRIDENGFLMPARKLDIEMTEDKKREIVVKDIPVSYSLYAGRPDYSLSVGIPGISPNDLLNVYMQWNEKTQRIRENDRFNIGYMTYYVVDVVLSEIHISKQHGVLLINARRVAGETKRE